MIDSEALSVIDATLKHQGFSEVGPGPADYEGTVSVHGKPVNVRLSIDDTSFSSMPVVTLLDRSQISYEVLAHIATNSTVCYSSAVGVPIDMFEPGQAVLRVLEDVASTLELSAKGQGAMQIADEYQFYWRGALDVRAFLEPCASGTFESVASFFAKQDGRIQFVGLGQNSSLFGYDIELPSQARVLHTSGILGPGPDRIVPTNIGELKSWYEAQGALETVSWETCLAILCRRKRFFIAAQNCFIGFAIEMPADLLAGLSKKAIREEALPRILSGRPLTKIERYGCTWSGAGSATLRNLADRRSLRKSKIALVGAGTIGSHLAKFLAQSGAGVEQVLTVYDTQLLSIGNIGRHLLGFGDVGKPKATAVAEEIKRFHPQIKIQGLQLDALGVWAELAKMDIIIDATGDWNVQNAINALFLGNGPKPGCVLHSWVVANGAAAQVFINANDEFACFRCLKPDFEKPWRYNAVRSDHPVNIQPARCDDGAYIPFSVGASAIAASLACDAALDVVNGKLSPRLRTVAIDFERSQYVRPVSPPRSEHCPACKKLRA